MSIDWKKSLEIAGIAITLVGVGAGGSWAVYKDNASNTKTTYEERLSTYKEKLEAYEESDKKNFPELLKNMSAVADSLQERMNILNDYDSLKKENELLHSSNIELSESLEVDAANYLHKINSLEEQLTSEKAKYQKQINSLQNEIDTFRAAVTPFELKQGNGITLKNGLVTVGYSDSNLNNVCKVTVNNEKYELEAGSSVDIMVKERSCKVILNRCSYGSSTPANFELICS